MSHKTVPCTTLNCRGWVIFYGAQKVFSRKNLKFCLIPFIGEGRKNGGAK